jgi:hypothetical protein
MDKDILPTVVGRDEPKTLVLIEKLDRTRCHKNPRKLSGVAPTAKIFAKRGARNEHRVERGNNNRSRGVFVSTRLVP